MCFTVRKINIMLSLLLVVVCSWGTSNGCEEFYNHSANRSENQFAQTGSLLV